MRKKFNPYTFPPWLKNIRNVTAQFIIPFSIFQGIRTLLLPTTFDVLFLTILIALAVAFHYEWI
ncbi:hypothetical protein H1Z61_08650 [Bacillus aquiflavi]|uniref:Uncharacterized protein n=1 Tax=Bacillus aquiflavi TaxID=2672567 RepID=A0A6B3VW60_9BACI|nr:hypothetical protein [Bacillus aquiflavi]MBA4537210.1 hypothetical protein [Bacillus aquiflavi]NEY81468.1 hypothetical protein [Bacillus aquiflavi]UAC47427.1 hypothetical protein K6959_12055 [Bacillus aquiflavi]